MPLATQSATGSIGRFVLLGFASALSACSGGSPRGTPATPVARTSRGLASDAGLAEVAVVHDAAAQPVTPRQLAALLSPTGTLRPLIHRKLVVFDVDTGLVNVVCEGDALAASATWDRMIGLQAQEPHCIAGKDDLIGCAVLTRGAVGSPFLALTFQRTDSRLVGLIISQTGSRPALDVMLAKTQEVRARLDGPEC